MKQLPEQTRDALLKYLLKRPMDEIEGGVVALRNLKECKCEKIQKVEETPQTKKQK